MPGRGSGGSKSSPNKTGNSVARPDVPMNPGLSDVMDTLDLRGLKCPLPALLARRALRKKADGGCIHVLTDDPMAPVDIPHMCWREGFEVLAAEARGGVTDFRLRRP